MIYDKTAAFFFPVKKIVGIFSLIIISTTRRKKKRDVYSVAQRLTYIFLKDIVKGGGIWVRRRYMKDNGRTHVSFRKFRKV